ncbi:hypothetical protein DFS34DRAFT_646934 [Phlyctochytrium arcticum]|nr:hypothetical protein DFS34DRAFT_646934 [Phlyctochytrium arcticum]
MSKPTIIFHLPLPSMHAKRRLHRSQGGAPKASTKPTKAFEWNVHAEEFRPAAEVKLAVAAAAERSELNPDAAEFVPMGQYYPAPYIIPWQFVPIYFVPVYTYHPQCF